MKTPLTVLPIRKIFTFAGILSSMLSAIPDINAMVASIYEEKFLGFSTSVTETHNTDYSTAVDDISEIWNRTVWIANDKKTPEERQPTLDDPPTGLT